MKNRALIITIAGLVAALFAIILNLAPAADASTGRTLAIESAIAALVALGCGVVTLRKGGGWRFLAIAMIGPSIFVLADAGMRIALYLRAGILKKCLRQSRSGLHQSLRLCARFLTA